MKLISISDATEQGIERIRKPNWSDSLDHIKLDLMNGKRGPWVHLYAPFNKECNGSDPVDMLFGVHPMLPFGCEHSKEFVQYTGPMPDSEEYKAACAVFDGCISGRKISK